jgi:hypothetical protein
MYKTIAKKRTYDYDSKQSDIQLFFLLHPFSKKRKLMLLFPLSEKPDCLRHTNRSEFKLTEGYGFRKIVKLCNAVYVSRRFIDEPI